MLISKRAEEIMLNTFKFPKKDDGTDTKGTKNPLSGLGGSETDKKELGPVKKASGSSDGSDSEKPGSNGKKGTDPSHEKPGTGDSSPSGGLGMGRIMGIIFAVVAVVLAACGAVFFLRQKRLKAGRFQP